VSNDSITWRRGSRVDSNTFGRNKLTLAFTRSRSAVLVEHDASFSSGAIASDQVPRTLAMPRKER
jgi:hypothetical protein